jgi:site-specific recombinase XerD
MKTIEEFLQALTARGCSVETLRAYRSDLTIFRKFLRERHQRVSSVKPRDITEYVLWLQSRPGVGNNAAPTSIARRLAVLSAFYEYRRSTRSGGSENPVKLYIRPRLPRGVAKPIDRPILKKIIDAAGNQRDRALLMLFANSGLRLAEVASLSRDDVSVEQVEQADGSIRTLGVGTVVGKGNRRRQFILDEATLSAIAVYLNARKDGDPALFVSNRQQRLSRREIQHIFHGCCRRAGVARYNVHRLRHSYATEMANAGMPSMVLKEILGHANYNTTQIYFTIRPERLATEYFAAKQLIDMTDRFGSDTASSDAEGVQAPPARTEKSSP